MVQTTSLTLLPNNRSASAEDQYEFDVSECLHRLRYGRILALTGGCDLLGGSASVAEEIIRVIILYGRIRVKDIGKTLSEGSTAISESFSERARDLADKIDASAVQEALLQLVKWRFLIPTCPELQIIESELSLKRFNVSLAFFTAIRLVNC